MSFKEWWKTTLEMLSGFLIVLLITLMIGVSITVPFFCGYTVANVYGFGWGILVFILIVLTR
jgi:hypothetical protein